MTLYNGIMASMDEGSAPRTKEMYEYVAQKVDDFGLGKMDVHDPTLADGVSQLIRSTIQRGHERTAEQLYVVITKACPWIRESVTRPKHRPRSPRVLDEEEAGHTSSRRHQIPPCGWRWRWPCPVASDGGSCADCDGPTLIFVTN